MTENILDLEEALSILEKYDFSEDAKLSFVVSTVAKKARGEIARLEALVYVPGFSKCAKCDCVVISTDLSVANGTFAANNKPKDCPNGCGPMWKVSERDQRIELVKENEKLHDLLNQGKTP